MQLTLEKPGVNNSYNCSASAVLITGEGKHQGEKCLILGAAVLMNHLVRIDCITSKNFDEVALQLMEYTGTNTS